MKLIQWLRGAIKRLEASNDKISTFLQLRYDEMNRLFPHDTFGNDRVTLSFFEDTISDLNDIHLKISSDSLYEANYKRWIELIAI